MSMSSKRSADLPALPPELWLRIFHYATHVPGTLIPDVYAHVSLTGSIYTRSSNVALRHALVTKRALVRVCRQWWHLAVPYLYASVYIGRARSLSSLSTTLVRSAAGKGTLVSTRPLGEYTQRLDIAVRDRAGNVEAEFDPFITCMPHLAIVSIAVPHYYRGTELPNKILDALQYSAASLRVLDWSFTQVEPLFSRITELLAKCTQLRVLNYPRLVWSKQFQHGGIPLSVTTLRLHAILPIRMFPHFNSLVTRHPGPSSLQELILDLNDYLYHWEGFLQVYGSQLVSVHFYIPSVYSIDVQGHLQLLAQTCPALRRLTIISDHFSSFISSHLVFPPITYLALRATRGQSPKSDLEMLFAFLLELRSSVPSLQVVQLLDEHNVHCLLKTHTKFAVHALQSFMEATPFRIEDKEGTLLTDRLKALGYL